jgi:hypothetical protein
VENIFSNAFGSARSAPLQHLRRFADPPSARRQARRGSLNDRQEYHSELAIRRLIVPIGVATLVQSQ